MNILTRPESIILLILPIIGKIKRIILGKIKRIIDSGLLIAFQSGTVISTYITQDENVLQDWI